MTFKQLSDIPKLYNDPALLEYYKLENANGDKGVQNLSNQNSTPFNAGLFGNAMEPNGSNQGLYVNTPNLFFTGAGNDKAFACWFKPLTQPSANTKKTIFEWGNALSTIYVNYQDASSVKYLELTDGNSVDSQFPRIFDNGTYYNLITSYNQATKVWTTWINGKIIGTTTSSSPAPNGLFSLGFVFSGGLGQYFNCQIDDFSVWTRQLTQADANLINNIKSGFFSVL